MTTEGIAMKNDTTTRRDILRAGVLGGLGLSLADILQSEAEASSRSTTTRKNAIFIYLNGGQSHFESWDPKPNGGDVAGEFRPIGTSLPGLPGVRTYAATGGPGRQILRDARH